MRTHFVLITYFRTCVFDFKKPLISRRQISDRQHKENFYLHKESEVTVVAKESFEPLRLQAIKSVSLTTQHENTRTLILKEI